MKVNKGKSHDAVGDCITHPEHGQAYLMPSGRLWCPYQTHDNRKTGGTPWLDEQPAEIAAKAAKTETPTEVQPVAEPVEAIA
jgi:hypothetical protein